MGNMLTGRVSMKFPITLKIYFLLMFYFHFCVVWKIVNKNYNLNICVPTAFVKS